MDDGLLLSFHGFRLAPGILQGLGDDVFELSIGAAELIGCPFLHRSKRLRVEAQDKWLLLGQGSVDFFQQYH
jgi:hypothetical protein